MLATILVFTADEIWENLPADEREPRAESVHLALLPAASEADNAELLTSWAHLFGYRDAVLRQIGRCAHRKTDRQLARSATWKSRPAQMRMTT